MRRGLVQIREADKLMTNAALIQRCVDIPHDETPTKHGSHEQFVCARRAPRMGPFARAR